MILFITLTSVSIISIFFSNQGHSPYGIVYSTIFAGLVAGILIILGGCELFANGVECLGDRFNLSHATAGSLLAAVGTALPETMIPIIALITGRAEHREGIAIGAILGAPFMLSTLALFLLGVTVIVHDAFKKRESPYMNVNIKALIFELRFFILLMMFTLVVSLIKIRFLNYLLGILLFVSYALFIRYTIRHEALDGEEYTEDFHFWIFLGCPRRLRWVIGQVLVGLFFIVVGAHLFVEYISIFSIKSGIPAIILSLLIAPIATELPEKFNSISWTLKKKDTIAMANITGAMVFQSTIPVGVGMLFTEWRLNQTEIANIIIAMIMATIIMVFALVRKRVPGLLLITGGFFYLIYVLKVAFRIF